MRAVNNVMRHHQMQKHYKHVSGCSDHECSPDINELIERITNLEKGGNGGSCDCGEQLSEIVSNITVIKTEITTINTNISNINTDISVIKNVISDIYELIQNNPTTASERTVRISPLSATGLDNLDTTYTKLLGDIETAAEGKLDEYYSNVISSIVGSKSLTDPIDLDAIESATFCSSIFNVDLNTDNNGKITWDDLTDNPEYKRTYIKQFILASPSNQTRAAYVTNEMLKSFAVVTDVPSETSSVASISDYEPRCVRDDDPTMITLENQSVRLRGCPYLLL